MNYPTTNQKRFNTRTMSNNEQARETLRNAMNNIQQCMKETEDNEEKMRLYKKLDGLRNEMLCLDHPELKGRICPLCQEKYNGYGNNPHPIQVNGQVCDECNTTRVIPTRFRLWRS